MKTPISYGSENEETSFIRRIATPDRAGSNRKQKNRIAVVGATVGLIAASAVVGYTALRKGSVGEVSIPTEQLEASTQSAAASTQFVSPLDDAFYPSLEQLDTNPKDGAVSQTEYLGYLVKKKDADIAEIEAARLPKEIEADLIDQIEANFNIDGPCVVKAMKRIKANKMEIRGDNLKLLFYFLDEFCPTAPIEINQNLVDQYTPAPTQPPIVVDTPSGPTVIDLPVVEPGEPSTTIVVDTPSGPAVVEIPIVTDETPTEPHVVDTPSGPIVIDVPVVTEEISAPETTIVVDTPSGPIELDLPVVEPGEPSTTIVVDTPSGPAVVEIPIVTDETPTEPHVVDTPSGPIVIDVPVVPDTPVVTPAPKNEWMTKAQFKKLLNEYFAKDAKNLEDAIVRAKTEVHALVAKVNALDECIEQAASKFGWYGVYEQAPHFNNAVGWVTNVCLVGN